MKFLWQLKEDIKSNRFAVILITLELIFALVCFSVCFELSGGFISSVGFFSKNYDGNSVTASLDGDIKSISEELLSMSEIDSFFSVRYFIGDDSDGRTLYVGDCSENVFNASKLSFNGEMIDTDKDYGEALPCIVSKNMSEIYKIGEIYNISGTDFYIAGSFRDDNIFYMLGDMINQNFFMCCDKNNKLSESDLRESNVKNAFITAKEGISSMVLAASFGEISGVDSVSAFDFRDELSDDFDKLSGSLIIGVLVLLLSLLGFLSNNILSFDQNKKLYRAGLVTGQKNSIVVLLFSARLLICILLSGLITFLFKEQIASFLGGSALSLNHLLLSVITCFGIGCICVIVMTLRIVKMRV